jgi:hypothetical protein
MSPSLISDGKLCDQTWPRVCYLAEPLSNIHLVSRPNRFKVWWTKGVSDTPAYISCSFWDPFKQNGFFHYASRLKDRESQTMIKANYRQTMCFVSQSEWDLDVILNNALVDSWKTLIFKKDMFWLNNFWYSLNCVWELCKRWRNVNYPEIVLLL